MYGFCIALLFPLPIFLLSQTMKIAQLDSGKIFNLGNWVNHCAITRKQVTYLFDVALSLCAWLTCSLREC